MGIVPMAMYTYANVAAVPAWGFALHECHAHGHALHVLQLYPLGVRYGQLCATQAVHGQVMLLAYLASVLTRGYCTHSTGTAPMAMHACLAAVPTQGYCMHYMGAALMHACTVAVPTRGTVCTIQLS